MYKLAIITARGGSKRIPKKNIKDFLGRPILAYSIEAARESGLFNEIMVSTDDEEIAQIARTYGAKIPFFRSKAASNDYATTSEVLVEVLGDYLSSGIEFSHACCIYPCAPFVTSKLLIEGYSMLLEGNYSCVFPYLSFSYPIWRSLKLNNRQQLEMIWPENINTRSQDLPTAFHDAGQFYFFEVERFMRTKNLMIGDIGGIKLSEMHAQDIDTEDDWELAALKYKLMNNTTRGSN